MPKQSIIVLVDDDKYVVANWRKKSSEGNFTFYGYSNPDDFLREIEKFNDDTEFFIDVDIGDHSGILLVKKIQSLEYSKVNLCTGYEAEDIKGIQILNSVISKSFPY